MTYLSKFAALLVICFSVVTTSVAQTDVTPEVVAQHYWTAMQSNDWAKSASLIHPQSLHELRLSSDTFVDALLGFANESNLISYFGVSNKAEYQKLNDELVVERWFQTLSQQPGYKEVLKATTLKIVGSVRESENIAHVLYRRDVALFDAEGHRLTTAKFEEGNQLIGLHVEIKLPKPDTDRVEVLTLKRCERSWCIVVDDETREMLDSWTKSLEDTKQSMKKVINELASQQAKTVRKRNSRRVTKGRGK